MNLTRTLFCSLTFAGMTALAPAALADGPTAISTAANHAGLAANAGAIEMVHTHLHHVLNCLVGPGGDGFGGTGTDRHRQQRHGGGKEGRHRRTSGAEVERAYTVIS